MAADTSADTAASSPTPSGSSASAASKAAALQRGKACLRCRKRKMRCDGGKPACLQCVKAKKGDGCAYDDGKGKTRTQVLRESITRLEERIRELQDPEFTAASVTLFDPHSRQLSGSSSSSCSGSPGSTVLSAPSPYLDLSSSPQPGWQRLSVSSPLPFGDPFAVEEPPLELAQMLLEIFLPHRYQCGLDIHVDRLRDSLLPTSLVERPHPVLMNAIYLWSCYLSRPASLSEHESQYLAMTLRALPEALQFNKIVDVIRASCLLAQYFLSNGRYAEGDYHLSTAASLATNYGLHRLSSPNSLDALSSSFGPSPLQLEPAKDLVEEGERILAFWQVFNMDRCWSVALRRPTLLSDYEGSCTRIDTPWPQNMFDYEAGNVEGAANDSTVQRFLASQGQASSDMSGFSTPALRAKVSVLYDGAARLSASWSQHLAQPEAFDLSFRAFEYMLARFIPTLLPVQQLDGTVPEDRHAYIAMHVLGHGAMIQLHERFAMKNPASHEKCVRAARNILATMRHVQDADYDFLEPIVGSCLLAVGHILLREIARIKNAWPMLQDVDVYAEMDTVIYAMTKLGARFPILSFQVTELQEMLTSS